MYKVQTQVYICPFAVCGYNHTDKKKKLAFTEQIFEDNSYFDFYLNWTKNVENTGKNFIYALK